MIINNTTAIYQDIIDQRKGIITHSQALTNEQFNLYYRSGFKWHRPDLHPFQLFKFQALHQTGQKYLSILRRNFNSEVKRAAIHTSEAFRYDNREAYYENFYTLSSPVVQRLLAEGSRNWKDRSNIVYYMQNLIKKLQNYGLTSLKTYTKEQIQQRKEGIKKELLKKLYD